MTRPQLLTHPIDQIRSQRLRLVSVISLCLLALWAIGVTWGSGYGTPFYRDRLIEGYVRRDPLFHAALSGMIETYSIASTGLDGLPTFGYHTGSHWLAAVIARIADISTLKVYHLIFPLLLPSLFIGTFLWLVNTLRPTYSGLFWTVLLVGFVGILPNIDLAVFKLEPRSILSESNALAFSLIFGTAALILHGFWQKSWFIYGALPLLCFTIGISKQSALFLMLAALGWLWLRRGYVRQPRYWLAAALVLGASGVAYLGTRGTYATVAIAPLDLFHYFEGSPAVWFVFNYGAALLHITLRAREHKGPYVDVELLLVLCIAGALPALLLRIPGASGLYFLELQRYVALALLLTKLPKRICRPIKVILAGALVLVLANVIMGLVSILLNGSIGREAGLPYATANAVLVQLESIDSQSDTALFIPRTHPYWQILADVWACGSVPFLAPAITNMALIEGLPSSDCDNAIDYGYHSYEWHGANLCETARHYGLRRVMVLEDVTTVREIVCQ